MVMISSGETDRIYFRLKSKDLPQTEYGGGIAIDTIASNFSLFKLKLSNIEHR
jgi:hypothetical protein